MNSVPASISLTKLVYSPPAVEFVWHVWSQPDIIVTMPDFLRSAWGFVSAMEEFHAGRVHFYVPCDQDGTPVGLAWGQVEKPGEFVLHGALLKEFRRGRIACQTLNALVREVSAKLDVQTFKAFIPEKLRGALVIANCCGFRRSGLAEYSQSTMDGELVRIVPVLKEVA